jgi:hypothetical protein
MSAADRQPPAPLYPALARKFHDARSEELVSAFWRRHDTFRRSVREREGCPDWVFYEGPPTANGMPGVHHVMARLCKDIMCRYKTMTGHRVVRKAGWDTHGLPVERSVEKTLGIQGAQAILDYGLEPFNAKCRESVWACKGVWDEFTERVGYWVDLEHPYITYDNDYIESVWWILGQFHAKGMLYQGHKVVPYCPVCATPLSSHEMANSYRTVSDPSVYVKLKARDGGRTATSTSSPGPPRPGPCPRTWRWPWVATSPTPACASRGEVLILAEARVPVLEALGDVEVLGTLQGRRPAGPRATSSCCRSCAGGPARVRGGRRRLRDARFGHRHRAHGAGVRRGRLPGGPARGPGLPAPGRRQRVLHGRGDALAGACTSRRPTGRSSATCGAGRARARGDLHARVPLPRPLRQPADLLRHAQLVHPHQRHARAAGQGEPGHHLGAARGGGGPLRQLAGGQHRLEPQPQPLLGHAAERLALRRCGHQHLPCRAPNWARSPAATSRTWTCIARTWTTARLPLPQAGCGGTMRRTPEVIDCWFDSGSMPFAQYHYPFENGSCSPASTPPTSSARASTRRAAGSTPCWSSARS